jgi:hypothetical protein
MCKGYVHIVDARTFEHVDKLLVGRSSFSTPSPPPSRESSDRSRNRTRREPAPGRNPNVLLSPPSVDDAGPTMTSSYGMLESLFRPSRDMRSSGLRGIFRDEGLFRDDETPNCPEIGPDGSWLYPGGSSSSREEERLVGLPWTCPSAPGELVGLEWGPGGESLVVGSEWCLMKWQMCVDHVCLCCEICLYLLTRECLFLPEMGPHDGVSLSDRYCD